MTWTVSVVVIVAALFGCLWRGLQPGDGTAAREPSAGLPGDSALLLMQARLGAARDEEP